MATMLAIVCAVIHPAMLNGPDHVSIHLATVCSPYMPRPRLASDTPICVVAMYLSRRRTLSRMATTRRARPVSTLRKMLEAGARRADDRELRGDEEAVCEHEQQDEREGKQHGAHSSASSDGSSFTRFATAVTSARRRTSSTSNSKSPMTTRSC